jgi:hypothetical protein
MARYWWIPLAIVAVVAGSLVAAGAHSASPGLTHAAKTHAASLTSAEGVSPGHPMISASAGAARSAASFVTTDSVLSANWSGYAVHAGKYNSIVASWNVPAAHCTASRKFAAFWVGFDGFSSRSVEQIGMDSDCRASGEPHYYGWYEMFPAAPVFFAFTGIRPGDLITAAVRFSGTNTYTLELRDETRHWFRTIVKHENGLARSSAEVITEAPSSTTGVLPLADFGTVLYSSSAANGVAFKNLSPTKIIMVNGSGQMLDTTSPVGIGDRFHNTWLRSS